MTKFFVRAGVLLSLVGMVLSGIVAVVFVVITISNWRLDLLPYRAAAIGVMLLLAFFFYLGMESTLRDRRVYSHLVSFVVVNKNGEPLTYGKKVISNNLSTVEEITDAEHDLLASSLSWEDARTHSLVILNIRKLNTIAGYRGVNL